MVKYLCNVTERLGANSENIGFKVDFGLCTNILSLKAECRHLQDHENSF